VRVGDGSPSSREAEGEGDEGFYIAQGGKCTDLLVIGEEQNSGDIDATLPLSVLAGELKTATLTPVGRAPGEPG
jgi:hypothetical protein